MMTNRTCSWKTVLKINQSTWRLRLYYFEWCHCIAYSVVSVVIMPVYIPKQIITSSNEWWKNPAEQYHQQRQAKSKPELAESRLSRYTNINTEAPQSSSVAVPQLETWWCVITSYNSFEPTNKLKHNTRESTLLWGLPIIFWIALAVIITQVRVLI